MATNQFTYRQLDDVLMHLGFSRQRVEPKWLRYEHAPSDTEIILVEKSPTDMVRPSDAWSAREHLIRKGLIREEELDKMLNNQTSNRKAKAISPNQSKSKK